ncbi:UDP-N-acetylmuramoyl-L-alanine--D-glutamate ligase [soil metagenome]
MHALVHGLAVAGISTVRALQRRGWSVSVSDDRHDASLIDVAAELGVPIVTAPEHVDPLLEGVDLVVPAPGVPEWHWLVDAAQRRGIALASEIELAYRWEQEREGGPRPMLAVTGTDGKTTTTLLMVEMLAAAGLRSVAAGNTEVPLVDAIETDVDVFVVECTSFRLAWTSRFRADAAVWLNLAPDHLDWHRSIDTYTDAKARIFELQTPDDVAIGAVADPVVAARLAAAPARRRTFGLAGADYRVDDGRLVGPAGPITEVASMRRALPHDLTNALAAAAAVLETGLAAPADVARALATFAGPPHRIEHVATIGDVQWFDDSKATTPHAASVAIRAFEQVVLIAGGRNKGLDLSPMAAEADRVRAVVAIGEAADDVARVFAGRTTVTRAASMDEAVAAAADLARPGQTVLLSPGCASWDWYPTGGYAARGDHFRSAVLTQLSHRQESS